MFPAPSVLRFTFSQVFPSKTNDFPRSKGELQKINLNNVRRTRNNENLLDRLMTEILKNGFFTFYFSRNAVRERFDDLIKGEFLAPYRRFESPDNSNPVPVLR